MSSLRLLLHSGFYASSQRVQSGDCKDRFTKIHVRFFISSKTCSPEVPFLHWGPLSVLLCSIVVASCFNCDQELVEKQPRIVAFCQRNKCNPIIGIVEETRRKNCSYFVPWETTWEGLLHGERKELWLYFLRLLRRNLTCLSFWCFFENPLMPSP